MKERVLIAVKTYPVVSKKYTEVACTAGFREDGSWIRLYPVPFRLLGGDKRYRKYQWVEVDVIKNAKDRRPESYRVTEISSLGETVGTSGEWAERRRLILEKAKIHTNLKELISLTHENKVSLAVFKPAEIVDFVIEEAEPALEPGKISEAIDRLKQEDLFGAQKLEEFKRDFKMMPKLPKKFSYRFKDDAGTLSELMIEDWETGQLYLNCARTSSPAEAAEKVKQKYLDDFARTKDLYFFLGTTLQWHIRKAPNPYVIVGTFHPPFLRQPSLSDF